MKAIWNHYLARFLLLPQLFERLGLPTRRGNHFSFTMLVEPNDRC